MLIPAVLPAQIVDDSSINDLEEGRVSFEEGAFVAYLADTVSPGYVQKVFDEMELVIRQLNIKPLSVIIVSRPSDSTRIALEDHPKVRAMVPIRPGDIRMLLVDSLRTEGVDEKDIADIIADKLKESPVGSYLIEFDYSVTTGLAADILHQFEELVFRFTPASPRTVTLLTEPGMEQEAMDRVDQLPFVSYTARIGIIGDQ